jgi:hypothetical protein
MSLSIYCCNAPPIIDKGIQMLSEDLIKKLRFIWLILICCILSAYFIYFGINKTIKGNIVIFLLIGLAMLVGWYLCVNFVFSKIAPSFYKAFLLKNPNFKFTLMMLRVILTKEAYESIFNVPSVNPERNES